MPCTIALITRLENQDPNGYFVYLGYSTSSQIDNSINTITDKGSDGFGILDPLDNGFNSESPNDNVVLNNPYVEGSGITNVTRFTALSYGIAVNTGNMVAAFHGFLYIVGDPMQTGDVETYITNGCGDIEAFEIEVIAFCSISASF